MASKKTDVSILVKGLGMGMAFLQALTEEVVAAGGFEEMIHFLTKESARPICKKIAAAIVDSDWKIPVSLIERLVRESECSDPEYIDEDSKYNWEYGIDLEKKFGIPVICFSNEGQVDDSYRPYPRVPQCLVDQLIGRYSEFPLIVKWEGEDHIVVMRSSLDDFLRDGGTNVEEYTRNLRIAPAKFFNLEQ